MRWQLGGSLLLHAAVLAALIFLQPAAAPKPSDEQPVHVELVTPPPRHPAIDARLPFDERFEIPLETIRAIDDTKSRHGRVIAIGTTTTRALEGSANDNGALVVAKRGQPWAAFMYNGSVAYAYLGKDFRLNPQQ